MVSPKAKSHVCHTPVEMRAVAAEWVVGVPPGTRVALSGDLGAGKTEFVRGVAEGLGLSPEVVSSPTFGLVHRYADATGNTVLIHVDLYRLTSADELAGIDADEWLWGTDPGAKIVAVEWAERLSQWGVPHPPMWRVTIRGILGAPDSRKMDVQPPEGGG